MNNVWSLTRILDFTPNAMLKIFCDCTTIMSIVPENPILDTKSIHLLPLCQKIIYIYCLTLRKWRPSCIFPSFLKFRMFKSYSWNPIVWRMFVPNFMSIWKMFLVRKPTITFAYTSSGFIPKPRLWRHLGLMQIKCLLQDFLSGNQATSVLQIHMSPKPSKSNTLLMTAIWQLY